MQPLSTNVHGASRMVHWMAAGRMHQCPNAQLPISSPQHASSCGGINAAAATGDVGAAAGIGRDKIGRRSLRTASQRWCACAQRSAACAAPSRAPTRSMPGRPTRWRRCRLSCRKQRTSTCEPPPARAAPTCTCLRRWPLASQPKAPCACRASPTRAG